MSTAQPYNAQNSLQALFKLKTKVGPVGVSLRNAPSLTGLASSIRLMDPELAVAAPSLPQEFELAA